MMTAHIDKVDMKFASESVRVIKREIYELDRDDKASGGPTAASENRPPTARTIKHATAAAAATRHEWVPDIAQPSYGK